MSTREDLLARIRAARPDVPATERPGQRPVPRNYLRSRPMPEGIIGRFCERTADYQAVVERTSSAALGPVVGRALAALGAGLVGVPAGLWPQALVGWAPEVRTVVDRPELPLDITTLRSLDAVVTGSVLGIAETGTVVLDGGTVCGRRALTLVPDAHVCVVRAEDLVDDVPAAIARLDPRHPLTWVSGPSATSDIELTRVEGVHGPRRLYVIVVDRT